MNHRISKLSSLSQVEFSAEEKRLVQRLGLGADIGARAEVWLGDGAADSPFAAVTEPPPYQSQWVEIKSEVPQPQSGSAAAILAAFPAAVLLGFDSTSDSTNSSENSSAGDSAGSDDSTVLDRVLFDLGFVRLDSGLAAAGRRHYLRSDRLEDLALLGEASAERWISMSSLGSNGRFANQLFQYVFLRLYGLRNNAQVAASDWVGNYLYGLAPSESLPQLPAMVFQPFVGAELGLWYTDAPPVNLDFWGYFQVIPKAYRRHRRLIQRLLRPRPDVSAPIDRWLVEAVGTGATTVGIHIRRGDYVRLAPDVSEFRTVPLAPYHTALAELWPQLVRPRLIIATDAPELVAEFQAYDPIVVPAALLSFPPWSFFPDFYALSRCEHIFVVNSSFSRMASLLAKESTSVQIIDMKEQRFKPYAPWDDTYFWDRFEE